MWEDSTVRRGTGDWSRREEGRMTLKQRGGKHNEGRESPMKDRSASSSYTDIFVSLTSPMMLSVGDSELPPVLPS